MKKFKLGLFFLILAVTCTAAMHGLSPNAGLQGPVAPTYGGPGEKAGASPTVIDVTTNKADGAYRAGETIDILVTFSEAEYSHGDAADHLGDWDFGRGRKLHLRQRVSILAFNYIVLAGHESIDLDCVGADALFTNGGTIRNAGAENAVLSLPAPGTTGSLGANKNIIIDTTAPDAPAVSGTTPTDDTTTTWNWASGGGGLDLPI